MNQRIYSNYPLDMLIAEAEELELVFSRVALSPMAARINRRVFVKIADEIALRRTREQNS